MYLKRQNSKVGGKSTSMSINKFMSAQRKEDDLLNAFINGTLKKKEIMGKSSQTFNPLNTEPSKPVSMFSQLNSTIDVKKVRKEIQSKAVEFAQKKLLEPSKQSYSVDYGYYIPGFHGEEEGFSGGMGIAVVSQERENKLKKRNQPGKRNFSTVSRNIKETIRQAEKESEPSESKDTFRERTIAPSKAKIRYQESEDALSVNYSFEMDESSGSEQDKQTVLVKDKTGRLRKVDVNDLPTAIREQIIKGNSKILDLNKIENNEDKAKIAEIVGKAPLKGFAKLNETEKNKELGRIIRLAGKNGEGECVFVQDSKGNVAAIELSKCDPQLARRLKRKAQGGVVKIGDLGNLTEEVYNTLAKQLKEKDSQGQEREIREALEKNDSLEVRDSQGRARRLTVTDIAPALLDDMVRQGLVHKEGGKVHLDETKIKEALKQGGEIGDKLKNSVVCEFVDWNEESENENEEEEKLSFVSNIEESKIGSGNPSEMEGIQKTNKPSPVRKDSRGRYVDSEGRVLGADQVALLNEKVVRRDSQGRGYDREGNLIIDAEASVKVNMDCKGRYLDEEGNLLRPEQIEAINSRIVRKDSEGRGYDREGNVILDRIEGSPVRINKESKYEDSEGRILTPYEISILKGNIARRDSRGRCYNKEGNIIIDVMSPRKVRKDSKGRFIDEEGNTVSPEEVAKIEGRVVRTDSQGRGYDREGNVIIDSQLIEKSNKPIYRDKEGNILTPGEKAEIEKRIVRTDSKGRSYDKEGNIILTEHIPNKYRKDSIRSESVSAQGNKFKRNQAKQQDKYNLENKGEEPFNTGTGGIDSNMEDQAASWSDEEASEEESSDISEEDSARIKPENTVMLIDSKGRYTDQNGNLLSAEIVSQLNKQIKRKDSKGRGFDENGKCIFDPSKPAKTRVVVDSEGKIVSPEELNALTDHIDSEGRHFDREGRLIGQRISLENTEEPEFKTVLKNRKAVTKDKEGNCYDKEGYLLNEDGIRVCEVKSIKDPLKGQNGEVTLRRDKQGNYYDSEGYLLDKRGNRASEKPILTDLMASQTNREESPSRVKRESARKDRDGKEYDSEGYLLDKDGYRQSESQPGIKRKVARRDSKGREYDSEGFLLDSNGYRREDNSPRTKRKVARRDSKGREYDSEGYLLDNNGYREISHEPKLRHKAAKTDSKGRKYDSEGYLLNSEGYRISEPGVSFTPSKPKILTPVRKDSKGREYSKEGYLLNPDGTVNIPNSPEKKRKIARKDSKGRLFDKEGHELNKEGYLMHQIIGNDSESSNNLTPDQSTNKSVYLKGDDNITKKYSIDPSKKHKIARKDSKGRCFDSEGHLLTPEGYRLIDSESKNKNSSSPNNKEEFRQKNNLKLEIFSDSEEKESKIGKLQSEPVSPTQMKPSKANNMEVNPSFSNAASQISANSSRELNTKLDNISAIEDSNPSEMVILTDKKGNEMRIPANSIPPEILSKLRKLKIYDSDTAIHVDKSTLPKDVLATLTALSKNNIVFNDGEAIQLSFLKKDGNLKEIIKNYLARTDSEQLTSEGISAMKLTKKQRTRLNELINKGKEKKLSTLLSIGVKDSKDFFYVKLKEESKVPINAIPRELYKKLKKYGKVKKDGRLFVDLSDSPSLVSDLLSSLSNEKIKAFDSNNSFEVSLSKIADIEEILKTREGDSVRLEELSAVASARIAAAAEQPSCMINIITDGYSFQADKALLPSFILEKVNKFISGDKLDLDRLKKVCHKFSSQQFTDFQSLLKHFGEELGKLKKENIFSGSESVIMEESNENESEKDLRASLKKHRRVVSQKEQKLRESLQSKEFAEDNPESPSRNSEMPLYFETTPKRGVRTPTRNSLFKMSSTHLDERVASPLTIEIIDKKKKKKVLSDNESVSSHSVSPKKRKSKAASKQRCT